MPVRSVLIPALDCGVIAPLRSRLSRSDRSLTVAAQNRVSHVIDRSQTEIDNMAIEPLSAVPQEPVRRPVMRQRWENLTFLHWRYRVADVRPLLPAGLEPDVYDGEAWVGLVPFRVRGLTLPKAPAVPWLSTFPETNVRTYVIDRTGRRGVWFFSLDAARLPAVAGARLLYGLP